jgi:hypothetical protein
MDYVFLIVIGIVIAVAIYYLYIEINDIRKAFVEFKSMIGLEPSKKPERSTRRQPPPFDPMMMGGQHFPFCHIPPPDTKKEKPPTEKKTVTDDNKPKTCSPDNKPPCAVPDVKALRESMHLPPKPEKPKDDISMANHDGTDDDLEDYETKSEDIPEYHPPAEEEKSPEVSDDDDDPFQGKKIKPVDEKEEKLIEYEDEEDENDDDDEETDDKKTSTGLKDITAYDLDELKQLAKKNGFNLSYHDKHDGQVKRYKKAQLYKLLQKSLPLTIE